MVLDSGEAARARRERAAAAWALEDCAVVVAAGLPVPIAGTDQFHEFHAHPEFRYLAGASLEGAVLCFDPAHGWALFAPRPSQEERVWTGDPPPLAALARLSGVARVAPLPELGAWLERRRGLPLAAIGSPDLVRHPARYGLAAWPALEVEVDEDLSARLSEAVAELRRAKDPWELDLMRQAAAATRRGHLAAMRLARPGMSERQLQVELEAEFFRAGAERTAYGSIVASGPNAAVLHFAPTARVLGEEDLVLIDAGAERNGYASDVTRTFPAGPRFAGPRRDLYALVLEVQEEAIRGVFPGKEYRELHLEASVRIADGLRQLGILRGDPQGLVERDVHALFFPHGLGHLLGLSTHDAGGCLAGRERSSRFGLKWLRADLPLQEGYVVTVEPGVYFIPALLRDESIRSRFADAVVWERVDGLMEVGGIRIEDDVLVTASGAEVLTAGIPKGIDEIEEIRGEALA